MELYTNKRVIAGFLISMTALLVLGFFSFRNNQRLLSARLSVFHTIEVLYHIEQAKSNAVRIDESIAWYSLTGDTTFLDEHKHELEQATIHFTKLAALTEDNLNQKIQLDSLRIVGRRKLNIHQAFVAAKKDTTEENQLSAILLVQNREASRQIYAIIDGLLAEENVLLEQRTARGKVEINRFQVTFFSLLGLIFIILIIVFVVVNRTLRAKTLAERNTRLVNQELESFTYSVSHDLRAPLRSILGFSQVIKEDYAHVLTEGGNRSLEKVMRNARQMGQLIDDLLDFSRMGRKELHITSVNTQLQVDEVIQEIIENNPNAQKYLHVLMLPDMHGDSNMMKQVWINLISNAVKYTRTLAEPRIEIGSVQNDQTVYYVRDNGVGFDMRYYEKLFNVFQRLHTNLEFEGTGVGLALVHRIITRHHGKVWAEAKPNEGATFYFSIPTR